MVRNLLCPFEIVKFIGRIFYNSLCTLHKVLYPFLFRIQSCQSYSCNSTQTYKAVTRPKTRTSVLQKHQRQLVKILPFFVFKEFHLLSLSILFSAIKMICGTTKSVTSLLLPSLFHHVKCVFLHLSEIVPLFCEK